MNLERQTSRSGVAPVIATLLMIAVAVAMSVIIFMWSQGFLSQTSSATGGQQGAQNQAAQSSVSIELATFVPDNTDGWCKTTLTSCQIVVVVRNVGAVAVSLGSVTISGLTSNTGFQGSLVAPSTTCTAAITLDAASGGDCSSPKATLALTSSSASAWVFKSSGATSVNKGSSVTLTFENFTGETAKTVTSVLSGDVISVKVTTSVGTFAQAQFTVP